MYIQTILQLTFGAIGGGVLVGETLSLSEMLLLTDCIFLTFCVNISRGYN